MKKVLVMVAGMALAFNAQATVNLNVDAEAIKDQTGTRIVENAGLVLLVADTSANGFVSSTVGTSNTLLAGQSLALGSFLNGGDDQIVGRSRVESAGFGNGDIEFQYVGTLGGAFLAGTKLAIYWFSDATTATANTAGGMHYNVNAATADANWVTPANGGTKSMTWFTTDAADLNGGGSVPTLNGNASQIIPVPEPSSVMLVVVGLLGMVGLIRRRS